MLLSPIAFIYLLHITTRNYSYENKKRVGIYLSIIAILMLVLRNIEIFVLRGYKFDYEIVPLQICHFANFVLLYAFYKDDKTFFSFAFLFNMLMAAISLIFADGLENYASLITFRGFAYIFGHILIVVISFWAYLNGFIKTEKKIVMKSMILIDLLVILSVFINNFFRLILNEASNYFYTAKPEGGTPLEFFYDLGSLNKIGAFEVNIIYVILYLIAVPLAIYIQYYIFFTLPKYIKNNK
jgi:hypothetical protein